MTTISFFLDTINLGFHSKPNKIDYSLLIDKISSQYSNAIVEKKIAYVCIKSENDSFTKYLAGMGFVVCHKRLLKYRIHNVMIHKPECNVEITLDTLDSESDIVVVGSNAIELMPLYKRHDVHVVGCKLSREIRRQCPMYTELTDEYYYTPPDSAS